MMSYLSWKDFPTGNNSISIVPLAAGGALPGGVRIGTYFCPVPIKQTVSDLSSWQRSKNLEGSGKVGIYSTAPNLCINYWPGKWVGHWAIPKKECRSVIPPTVQYTRGVG